MGIKVPVTSLCPCSKAISDYGAHNQRGYVTIEVRPTNARDGEVTLIWFEELIQIAEQAASCPVYPILKRQDERHVTMQAYDKPAFVEDIVRDCAVALQRDPRVSWFKVNVENHESIHNHAAFAEVQWQR
jgi:GTP cyclohydrolase I